jgi:hypothetical protein
VDLPLRNAVLFLAIACFASMTSGLTLQLHLATVDDVDHHDPAHCSLCTVLLFGVAKSHLETQTCVIYNSDSVVETIPEVGEVPLRGFAPPVLAPRPPPICAV